jgi:hypothetical protein
MTSDPKDNPQLSPLYNVLLDVEPKIRGVAYKYTSQEDFRKIKSVEEMQLVYWSEIVQRMHVCAATSIKRAKKWIEASNVAYQADNFYGFCSALRGLVEACADTFYTVSKIVDPICTNFAIIERALNENATKILLSQEIEDALIHYVFARKLTKTEKAGLASAHDAEHVKTYVECLANQEIVDFYSELCQVSHPSAMSLVPFLTGNEHYSLILHDEHLDRELNDDLLLRYKKAIVAGTNMSVLPAMCVLKLINEFDAPITEALRTDDRSLAPAVQMGLWQDMVSKIRASRAFS